MNNLIILPGNSIKNKAWGESILEHYGLQFESAHMVEYSHWESGEQNINFVEEIKKLRVHVATLKPDTEVYLFAKSAGSLLAFMAIEKKVIIPQQCVFFGIPFDLAAADLFKENWGAVDTFTLPALAFHNIADPTTSFEFTKEILQSHAPSITFVATHETDHWYGDFATYDNSLKKFLVTCAQ